MKKKLLIIFFFTIFLFLFIYSPDTNEKNDRVIEDNFYALKLKHASFLKNSPFKKTLQLSKKERKKLGIPPNKYYEREWELTMNPILGFPEPYKVFEAQEKRANISRKTPGDGSVGNDWIDRGPSEVGGRTRVVFFDPNDPQKERVFAGGVSGGLWVNENITDPTSSWSQVPSSISGIPSNLNISCITVDPNNSNIWYLGTGEQYTSGAAVGNGAYKTEDGGVTWTSLNIQLAGPNELNTASTKFLKGIYYINDIIAWDNNGTTDVFIAVGAQYYGDAANKNNVLGVQTAGLYKNTNGGTVWNRVEDSSMSFAWFSYTLYYTPNDLEISSDNNTLWMGTIASPYFGTEGGGRVYKSTDGSNWTQVTQLENSNRVELAVSSNPLNPDKIYALTQGKSAYDTGGNLIDGSRDPKIFATTDGFVNVTELPKPNDADDGIPANDFTRGQAFYDLVIEVDPTNDNIVYVGGIDLFRTDKGINTDEISDWAQISKWSNNNNLGVLTCSQVHADQHALTFRPNANNEAVIGCDGGVYYCSSLSTAETQDVFTAMNRDYNVTQFYYGGYGQDDTNELILGGAQDNGTPFIANASAGVNTSVYVSGGDGAYSVIDKDGNYMIASYINGNHEYINLPYTGSKYTIDNNYDEGDFINQASLDHNLDIMYSNGTNGSAAINRYILEGSSSVKSKLTNALLTDSPTAFKVSPHTLTSSTLLVGTETGKLLKLTNANNTNTSLVCWEDITDESSFVGSISAIEFGETENDIFVTFHNYGVRSIWYSSNGGASWVDKEGSNLPDIPIKCILQNPLAKNEIIIGTELGVWVSKNFNEDAPAWSSSYNGMRDVKVVDLDLRTSDNSVLASTHGRGFFTGKFDATTNSTFTISTANSVLEVCKSSLNAVFNFDYLPLGGYTATTSISVSGIPSGASSNLSATSFDSSVGTFDLTISDLNAVATGEYIITITAIGGATVSKDILLIVKDNVVGISTLLPIDGATQMNVTGTELTWNTDPQATEYDVQISTDAGFNTIVESETTCNPNYTIGSTLSLATVYYWRVRAKNSCNTSSFSPTKRFITGPNIDCITQSISFDSGDTPVNIFDAIQAFSTISVSSGNNFTITKVTLELNISHSYIHDIYISLKSPKGTIVRPFYYECAGENGLQVTFDDSAASTISCGTFPIVGNFIPYETLSSFNGENSVGDWELKIWDAYSGDEGVLNNWSIIFEYETCTEQTIVNSNFINSPLTVSANSTYILNQAETNASSDNSTAAQQKYMLTRLPLKGTVRLSGTPLLLGQTFTQDDINNNRVTYANSSGISTTDLFRVDITNATNGFLPNQEVTISIDTSLGTNDLFFKTTGTTVFPTVSTGTFFISSNSNLNNSFIELYNINGQKVFQKRLSINSGIIEKIETNGLASGMYILKISSDFAQGSKKLIIK
jgi:subtilisin-like proprotein convertase family protein